MATPKAMSQMKLETGWLCLDFANTMDWHASEHPVEGLTSYAALIDWTRKINLLSETTADQLSRLARQHPAEADSTLQRAIALREAIYRVFAAVSHGQTPAAVDLDTFNAELADQLARSKLTWTVDGFDWAWHGSEEALDQMLWWIIHSASELLTSEQLNRVGVCADDRGCGWLFFDTSRNRSRQWCDMRGCGNRAKARRHYEKVKSDE
jgi:predicted RNA-binding Zn ribbon-like protein